MKKTTSRTSSKATATKRTTKRNAARHLGGAQAERNWLTVFAVLILTVVMCVALVGFMKYQWGGYGKSARHGSSKQVTSRADAVAREQRIREIFDSITLDSSFSKVREDIFGDKRVYEWDNGRSYSSSREYKRNATVDATMSVARKAIADIDGVTYIGDEYAGSAAEQHHYKTDSGAYIRLSVVSEKLMTTTRGDQPLTDKERNAAPALVTIKVNLDDNNE